MSLKNLMRNLKPNWSVSSISSNNELIVSLWGHKPLLFKHPIERKQIYRDRIDRWSGNRM
jgi:hypothetical protein